MKHTERHSRAATCAQVVTGSHDHAHLTPNDPVFPLRKHYTRYSRNSAACMHLFRTNRERTLIGVTRACLGSEVNQAASQTRSTWISLSC